MRFFLNFKIISAAVLLFIFSSCSNSKSNHDSESKGEVKYFAGDNSGSNNYIVAFLGSSDGIPGTLKDIPNLKSEFNPQNGYGFQFANPEGGWIHATREQIFSESAKVAQKMLVADKEAYAQASPGGTFFFYVTSHGSQDGSSSASDGQFTFTEVAQALIKARTDGSKVVPFERLIVMFDTCFSGSNAQQVTNQLAANMGNPTVTGITNPTSSEVKDLQSQVDAVSAKEQNVSGLYKTAIFIGSARPIETAGDASDGGAGTVAFLESVRNFRKQAVAEQPMNEKGTSDLSKSQLGTIFKSPVKVHEVLEMMEKGAPGQVPVWCAEPAEVANDYFFNPPEGYLPPMFKNAAQGNVTRKCSQGLVGNG